MGNRENSGNLTLVREGGEIRKGQGNCGLPVVFCCTCGGHNLINITRVLLSKVCHAQDGLPMDNHSIHSGIHVGLSVYLWWFNKYQCLRGKYLEKSAKHQGICRGLERSHPDFIFISTYPESRYSFYLPADGRRLS